MFQTQKFQSHLKTWSRQNCQPCSNVFTQKSEKSVKGKPHSRNTMKANSFRAGQIFISFPSKKVVFQYSG